MSKNKTPIWFYFVLVLIPIFIILIAEIILQSIDYGKDLDQWFKVTKDKFILNPDIGARYFTNTKNYPHSNNDPFDVVKKKNSFRVFVLGGSTTAGFPYSPNGSFTRYIKDRLELNYPDKTVEVVNLGITAVNTYTVLDLLPGVIEKEPDLIILYTGHNEYYGALGVGSTESIGRSSFLIRLYLSLNKFKTFQFVKDVIAKSIKLVSADKKNASGTTLMARMASEKTIEYKSDLYEAGIEQFRNNLNDILLLTKKNNIPVIIGTLVSNIKDQKPFISTTFDGSSANNYYELGLKKIKENNYKVADSLMKYAKELDGLRFRAPEEFNKIIIQTAKKFNFHIVDIENEFKMNSQDHMVGYNLMVDHLHPTLEGYHLMGKLFYEEIEKLDLLNDKPIYKYSSNEQDRIIKENFAFSKVDSVASQLRILNLLNDWPFVTTKNKNAINNFSLKNRIDSLAFKIAIENYDWKTAHQKAYEYYLINKDYNNFVKEIKVIYSQYPFSMIYYKYASEQLIKNQQYDFALYFLEQLFRIEPDGFSTKWLGNISLFKKNNLMAIKYFSESLKYINNDPQIFYNLAISYMKLNKFDEAIKAIEMCLKIKPNYKNARQLLTELNKKAG